MLVLVLCSDLWVHYGQSGNIYFQRSPSDAPAAKGNESKPNPKHCLYKLLVLRTDCFISLPYSFALPIPLPCFYWAALGTSCVQPVIKSRSFEHARYKAKDVFNLRATNFVLYVNTSLLGFTQNTWRGTGPGSKTDISVRWSKIIKCLRGHLTAEERL